jgi:tRNA (guanine37-N1)-methyltransferase
VTVDAVNERPLQIAVVTLFPELFDVFARTSFVGRAQESGRLRLVMAPLRTHGLGKHQSVDDTPYGGGSGMVIRVDCLMDAVEAAEAELGGRADADREGKHRDRGEPRLPE